uniref:Bicaudal D-related protein homolog n=1 Tax=Hirondellea gigas TaxID=1518452 RepID=A0A2P2IBA0_9CRUS
MPHDLSNTDATTYQLEDYIYEMQCQAERGATGDGPSSDPDDVYSCLAEKESNLVLAAELGKALLSRNEILVEENERMAEEYSRKLEQLEQDKHLLRRKLTATEGEYEVKIHDLTADLMQVRSELDSYKDSNKLSGREHTLMVEQLSEQNQRLTSKLKESCRQGDQLNQQLHHLREKMNLRRSSLSAHLTTLDSLRDEILMLSDKKMELERRLSGLADERQGLSMTLDESSDRIQILEQQKEEVEAELRSKDRDIEDLRHTNLNLSDRLEAVSRASSSPSMGHTSLMNEMDLSENETSRPHSHQDLLEMEEDVECDEPIMVPLNEADSLKQMKNEIVDAVSQLRVLADQLRHQRRNSLNSLSTNSSDDFSANAALKAGMLCTVVKEVKSLIRTCLLREAQGQCGGCGSKTGDENPRLILEQECHKALEAVDKISIELHDVKDKLKIKGDEAENLNGQVTLHQARQNALQEERDNLKQDLATTHLAKDEIVKKSWDTRDQAVARKNNCEIELARTRIDLMQVNSQLLEAITQKVELSQQLDQWQQDMQQLLDDQMRRKLTKHELLHGDPVITTDSDSSSSDKTMPRKSTKRLFNLLSLLRK